MEFTENFKKLDIESQSMIEELGNSKNILSNLAKFSVNNITNDYNDRSYVFELKNNLVLKILREKGRSDQDIDALLDLDGIEYFPKLYAYEKEISESSPYLIMEKAQGIALSDLQRTKVEKAKREKINSIVLSAFRQMLERKRYDWDFKLEHVFWSEENQTIMWIDLGICDKHMETTEDEKTRELKDFETRLL